MFGLQDKIVGGFTATEVHTDSAWGTAASTWGLRLPLAPCPSKDTEQPNHSCHCRQHCCLCVPVLLTEPMCAEAVQMNLGLTSSCGNRNLWAPPCFSPWVGSTEEPGQLGPRGFRTLEVSRTPGAGPGAEQHHDQQGRAWPRQPGLSHHPGRLGGQPGPAKSPDHGQVGSEAPGHTGSQPTGWARLRPRDGGQGQMQPRDLQAVLGDKAGLRPGQESAVGWGWHQDWQGPWPGTGTAKLEPSTPAAGWGLGCRPWAGLRWGPWARGQGEAVVDTPGRAAGGHYGQLVPCRPWQRALTQGDWRWVNHPHQGQVASCSPWGENSLGSYQGVIHRQSIQMTLFSTCRFAATP